MPRPFAEIEADLALARRCVLEDEAKWTPIILALKVEKLGHPDHVNHLNVMKQLADERLLRGRAS